MRPLEACMLLPSENVAVTVTVPLTTAVPFHVVEVLPFWELTVFVPSLNCQLEKVTPLGPLAVHVVVPPLVTVVQDNVATLAGPYAYRLSVGQLYSSAPPRSSSMLKAVALRLADPTPFATRESYGCGKDRTLVLSETKSLK